MLHWIEVIAFILFALLCWAATIEAFVYAAGASWKKH